MRNVRSPSKSRTLRTLAVGAIVFLACPSKAHAAGYYNLGMFLTAQVGDFTWMSGASTSNATGTWGTIHIGSTSNVPPAEGDGGLWADMSGNIWIFGGYPNGDVNATNALWTFNTGNSQWTWMSGTSIQSGSTYGTKGSGATTNTPGSAYGVVSGTDLSGGLWMWGGYEQTKNSTTGGEVDTMWKYTPANSQWTWVAGASSASAPANYGPKGSASTTYSPGARMNAGSFGRDSSGNFWLLGGQTASGAHPSDLWEFSPSTSQWAWIAGSTTVNLSGNYGSQGLGSTSNYPGGRGDHMQWVDNLNNVWVFGGSGYDAKGNFGDLNDLWKYTPSNSQWTWVSGATTTAGVGTYGTIGVPSTTNTPSARMDPAGWAAQGKLYLFGGYAASNGDLNDLWAFNPATSQWTWVSGASTTGSSGAYGTLGVAAAANVPICRDYFNATADNLGTGWIFGGGQNESGTVQFNDLWRYR